MIFFVHFLCTFSLYNINDNNKVYEKTQTIDWSWINNGDIITCVGVGRKDIWNERKERR